MVLFYILECGQILRQKNAIFLISHDTFPKLLEHFLLWYQCQSQRHNLKEKILLAFGYAVAGDDYVIRSRPRQNYRPGHRIRFLRDILFIFASRFWCLATRAVNIYPSGSGKTVDGTTFVDSFGTKKK